MYDRSLLSFAVLCSDSKIKYSLFCCRDIKKDVKNKKGSDTIDLLHVNREGCEWEMFDNLIETKVLESVKSVQFSAHYFSQVPNLFYRYCKLKEALSKTHKMVYGQSFGWERWDKIK